MSHQSVTLLISKKKFRLGRMDPSEWTRSIRAVRDIPVAADSTPSVNSTRHVAYRPPIMVSPFLLALAVSYCQQTHWRWGQLWPYIWMGSLGTRLHREWNGRGDAGKTTPRVPSTCVQNAVLFLIIIHIIPSRRIYVAIDIPSLIPSISCRTTNGYHWNYVHAADDVSHTEN